MSISVDTQAVPTAKLTWEQALPKIQQKTIRSCFKGEEGRWFRERMEQLNEILSDVPTSMHGSQFNFYPMAKTEKGESGYFQTLAFQF